MSDTERKSPPVTLGDLAGAGLDELDPSPDDGLPRLRLVQPQSRGGGRPGTFENMQTLQSSAQIENAVLLRAKSIRQHYDNSQGFDGESTLRCWSDGGNVPSPEVASPVAPKCDVCPKAVWQNGGKPTCSSLVTWIIGIGPTREPHLLDFRGSSEKVARAIHSSNQKNGLPIFGTACDLGSVEIKNPKSGSVYHMIQSSNIRVLEDNELAAAREQWEKVKTYPLKGNPAATTKG